MREHFGIGTKRLRFNHHAKSGNKRNRGVSFDTPLKQPKGYYFMSFIAA